MFACLPIRQFSSSRKAISIFTHTHLNILIDFLIPSHEPSSIFHFVRCKRIYYERVNSVGKQRWNGAPDEKKKHKQTQTVKCLYLSFFDIFFFLSPFTPLFTVCLSIRLIFYCPSFRAHLASRFIVPNSSSFSKYILLISHK